MIAISYRRADSAGFTRALHERLVQRLGDDRVFLDVDGIDAGSDFRARIRDVISRCRALLVVIGPSWLAPRPGGGTRLEDPADVVRFEIATALERGIRVVPILVEGARMPAAAELPADIRELAGRNALTLSNERFDDDVDRLLKGLGLRRRTGALYATIAAAAAVALGFIAFRNLAPEPFALTVRVHGPRGIGDAVTGGDVVLDLGQDRRTRPLDANGEAVFTSVPGGFAKAEVTLTPRVPGFDTVPRRLRIPEDHVLAVALDSVRWRTTVRGSVVDGNGRPLAGVRLDFGAGIASATSDTAGNFSVTLPVAPGTVLPLRAVSGDVVGYHDPVTVPERTPLIVTFTPGG